MSGSWWRRNRFWLLALLPLLALALATSSFRLTRLYLPWEWSRPVDAHGVSGTLQQRYRELDGKQWDRRVTARVLEVVRADDTPDPSGRKPLRAAPGGQLWKTTLLLEAGPHNQLRFCTIALQDAAGNVYDANGSLVDAAGAPASGPSDPVCTPDFGPGPVWDPVLNEWKPEKSPLPPAWTASAAIVLPVGVQPTAVRIGWNKPDYLLLSVPS